MAEKSYHEQERNKCTLELRELQNELPKFLRDYFRGIENSTAPRTQIGYAIDLRTFFEFVKDNNSTYRDVDMHDIGIDILSQLNAQDIEEYLDYLKYYVKNGHEYTNDERAIKRKLSALRSIIFIKKESSMRTLFCRWICQSFTKNRLYALIMTRSMIC